jgi:hypothetical protein
VIALRDGEKRMPSALAQLWSHFQRHRSPFLKNSVTGEVAIAIIVRAFDNRAESRLLILTATHRLPVDPQRERRVRVPHFVHDRAGSSPSA